MLRSPGASLPSWAIFFLPIVIVLILLLPQGVQARWSLVPRVYVEEQYDSNLFVTEKNEKDDFATVISPGVNLAYETPTALVNLDYGYRHFFYYDFTDLDYDDHRGTLEARKDFGPRFSLALSDVLLRSKDPIEFTGQEESQLPSIRAGERNRYTRNIVRPEATFRFAERSSLKLGYQNQILRNDAENVADQDENRANALLGHRFGIHHGIELFYEYINQDFGSTTPPQPSGDFKANTGRGRYTYYFDPKSSMFFEYLYVDKDVDQESAAFSDYQLHNARLGFSRDLYENFSVSASAGYLLRRAHDQNDVDGITGRLNFSGQYKSLETNVYGETGYGDDFTSAEIRGFFHFWRGGGNATYQLLERLRAETSFSVNRQKFLDINRTDTYYNFRGGLRYQVLKWLFFSLDYEYNNRDSNVPLLGYTRNRVFFRVTFQHDVAETYQ